MSSAFSSDLKTDALRDRYAQRPRDADSSSDTSSGEDTPHTEEDLEKEKKTFGRTPNGTGKASPPRRGPMQACMRGRALQAYTKLT
jgi:hypothetical protein